MSIINRKISIKCQTPKHLTKFYLLSLLPESESAKLVVMVMIIIVVMPVMVIMVIGTDRKTRKSRTDRQTDLTFKLDFPGKLCRVAFAILATFLFLARSKQG